MSEEPKPLSREDALSLHRIAYHEAGHFVVAENYKLEPFLLVKWQGPSGHYRAFTGSNFHQPTATNFQNAAVGYAGWLAEQIGMTDPKHWKRMNVDLDAYYKDFLAIDQNEADQKLVSMLASDKRKDALKVSWTILNRNLPKLQKIAEQLRRERGGHGSLKTFLDTHKVNEETIRNLLAGHSEKVVQRFIEYSKSIGKLEAN